MAGSSFPRCPRPAGPGEQQLLAGSALELTRAAPSLLDDAALG